MSREPITISIEEKIINKIDSAKGKNEPRSRFIEDIISEYLKKKDSERTLILSKINAKKTNSQKKRFSY